MSDKKYIAISESNDNGVVQYISVNIGDMLEYINDMESYDEEPPYISIGYYDTSGKSTYTKEFPCIDINIYLGWAITVYDDIAFIRHFKNDPGKILDVYNHIALLTEAAGYTMNYEEVLIAISNTIFKILKDWVHPLDASEDCNLSKDRSEMFSEMKYKSTFRVSLEKFYVDDIYCKNVILSRDGIVNSNPILDLHKAIEGNGIDFLIYPDGSIFIKDFPTWQHFDEIQQFGGVRILEFCKDCSSYYKSIGGDLSKEDSFDKYKSLIDDLVHDLKWKCIR